MTEHADALARAEAVDATLGLTEFTSRDVPPEVRTWLARLALLYGVPFEHLVPDATMLPPESIRFFYLDANWVEAMVDGAFSVGVHSQRDLRFHRVMQTAVRDATDLAAGKLRSELRGVEDGDGSTPQETAVTNGTRAGLLMRSEIVSGWPGLEVTGYSGSDTDSPAVPIVRLDRLAPDLLVCLFDEVPALVVVNEPREGLHFGVGDLEQADVRWRGNADHGRLNLQATAARLAAKPAVVGALQGRDFRPGDFAALLIDSPDEQHFTVPSVPSVPSATRNEGTT